jgi:hypothetical protein
MYGGAILHQKLAIIAGGCEESVNTACRFDEDADVFQT